MRLRDLISASLNIKTSLKQSAITFKIFKSDWTSGKKRIIDLDFREDFLIPISKSFLMIDSRNFKIKEINLLIFKLLETFSAEKRVFWGQNSSLSIIIKKIKENSKNIKRRKFINLIKNYKVNLSIILTYMEISKIGINIIFEKSKFKFI